MSTATMPTELPNWAGLSSVPRARVRAAIAGRHPAHGRETALRVRFPDGSSIGRGVRPTHS